MTDNEIIKALECCIELFYENNVRCDQTIEGLADDVKSIFADLINRQKAEIERLKKHLDMRHKDLSYSRKLNTQINDLNLKLLAERKTTKTEAIKEFAEKLKERFCSLEYKADTERKTLPIDFVKEQIEWILKDVSVETIDSLTKEMTGSEK